jgi:hypothetical protein
MKGEGMNKKGTNEKGRRKGRKELMKRRTLKLLFVLRKLKFSIESTCNMYE